MRMEMLLHHRGPEWSNRPRLKDHPATIRPVSAAMAQGLGLPSLLEYLQSEGTHQDH